MHFSIPTTQELAVEGGSTYTAFNLHVNGVLHCTVRYSQLSDLNERLKQEFGVESLPTFPPKRLFSVKGADLEERKLQLEKYVQDICQRPQICNGATFTSFLSRAQQEAQLEKSSPANFEIFLMNGSKIKISIQSTDKTDAILENAMAALGIEEDLTYYFGLFLVKSKEEGRFSLVRQLQEFECPFLSLKSLQNLSEYRIVLRKVYWDQSFDQIIWKDAIGLNLLHVQAESDVLIGWTVTSKEAKKRLNNLKGKGSKRGFVEFCQTLPQYGFIELDPCATDYPQDHTPVNISVGNYKLIFKLTMKDNTVKKETFQVTKIKGWKISSIVTKRENENSMILSFEYLINKGNLRWIKVTTDQAIMMSMSIKSMVDELLRKRRGDRIKRPVDRNCNGQKQIYKPRDKNTEGLFDPSEVEISGFESSSGIQKAKDSVKKLSDILAISSLSGNASASKPEANSEDASAIETTFEKIGDDDL